MDATAGGTVAVAGAALCFAPSPGAARTAVGSTPRQRLIAAATARAIQRRHGKSCGYFSTKARSIA